MVYRHFHFRYASNLHCYCAQFRVYKIRVNYYNDLFNELIAE